MLREKEDLVTKTFHNGWEQPFTRVKGSILGMTPSKTPNMTAF